MQKQVLELLPHNGRTTQPKGNAELLGFGFYGINKPDRIVESSLRLYSEFVSFIRLAIDQPEW